MTHAAIPAMRYGKQLPPVYLEKTINGVYDPRSLPASQKHGLTIGMGMTEKQGGRMLGVIPLQRLNRLMKLPYRRA